MEKVVSDSGVIRVIVRELRDDLSEVPLGLMWWQRRYATEPWRAAEAVAVARRNSEDVITGDPKAYWYAKVCNAMADGLALAAFVGSKQADQWVYGAPTAVLLALPDQIDRGRAVLLHVSREAFGGEEGERVMLGWAREWAAAQGRKLMREVVTREWKDA